MFFFTQRMQGMYLYKKFLLPAFYSNNLLLVLAARWLITDPPEGCQPLERLCDSSTGGKRKFPLFFVQESVYFQVARTIALVRKINSFIYLLHVMHIFDIKSKLLQKKANLIFLNITYIQIYILLPHCSNSYERVTYLLQSNNSFTKHSEILPH